ncbi:hypothetical protein M407DRAFT_96960, partial [Tulasnella calospora MUT 4182]
PRTEAICDLRSRGFLLQGQQRAHTLFNCFLDISHLRPPPCSPRTSLTINTKRRACQLTRSSWPPPFSSFTMRVLSLATFAAVFATFAAATLDEPARPRPAEHGTNIHRLQARKKEVEIRAKYPEFFKRDSLPSDLPNPCEGFPFPIGKRGNPSDFERSHDLQVLSPRQVAELVIKRGEYTHTNGTRLVDRDYLDILDMAERDNESRSKWARAARDYFSESLVNLSMPIYRRWKEHHLKKTDSMFPLSKNVVFKVRDIPAIERALLDDPTFTEASIGGYRITRRFIEAANGLN